VSLQAGGIGVMTATIWPTHIGVLNVMGHEPWGFTPYKREQIYWELLDGILTGHIKTKIQVPAGEYSAMIFSHHPTSGLLVGLPKRWEHPLRFTDEGEIDIHGIVREDF
jgi:hypothetical protein